jgi:hypothetical protein
VDHVRERLDLAVAHLATGRGSLRERVLDVYRDHLRALVPQEFDFNREVRRSFEDLVKTFDKIVDRTIRNPEPWNLKLHGGAFEIAKNKIQEKTAQKIAKSIWRIYTDVNSALIEEL